MAWIPGHDGCCAVSRLARARPCRVEILSAEFPIAWAANCFVKSAGAIAAILPRAAELLVQSGPRPALPKRRLFGLCGGAGGHFQEHDSRQQYGRDGGLCSRQPDRSGRSESGGHRGRCAGAENRQAAAGYYVGRHRESASFRRSASTTMATRAALALLLSSCSHDMRSHLTGPFPKKFSAWPLFVGTGSDLKPNKGVVPTISTPRSSASTRAGIRRRRFWCTAWRRMSRRS